jgi:hypothetical protein
LAAVSSLDESVFILLVDFGKQYWSGPWSIRVLQCQKGFGQYIVLPFHKSGSHISMVIPNELPLIYSTFSLTHSSTLIAYKWLRICVMSTDFATWPDHARFLHVYHVSLDPSFYHWVANFAS